MRPDVDPRLDPAFEAEVRRQLTHLVDAIATPCAEEALAHLPLRLNGRVPGRAAATHRRRRLAVAGGGMAAVAAAIVAFVVVPDRSSDTNVSTHGGTSTSSTPTTSSTTTTGPSTPTSTGTPGTAAPPPGSGGGQDCQQQDQDPEVASSGTLPDGRTWQYRVYGQLPDVSAEVLVDGTPVTDGSLGAEEQQEALPDGRLVWGNVVRIDGGEIADFVVPASATRIEAYVWDGSQREVDVLCPRGIPTVEGLRYAALFTPSGSEVTAVVALDGNGAAVAHTDLVLIPDSGGPEAMTAVTSGDLPNGPWSLRVGGDAELLAVQLDLPPTPSTEEGSGAAVRSRPELLRDTWYASSVWDGTAGRYFLWGFTRADVSEVVVTMFDDANHHDEVVRIPTMAPGGTGAEGRVFVGEFPAGPGIRLIEGHRADGTKVVELPEPENGSIGNGMPETANVRIPMHELA